MPPGWLVVMAAFVALTPIVVWIRSVWVLPKSVRKHEHLFGSTLVSVLMVLVFMAMAAAALYGATYVDGPLETACWVVSICLALFACLPAFFSVKVHARLAREHTR